MKKFIKELSKEYITRTNVYRWFGIITSLSAYGLCWVLFGWQLALVFFLWEWSLNAHKEWKERKNRTRELGKEIIKSFNED